MGNDNAPDLARQRVREIRALTGARFVAAMFVIGFHSEHVHGDHLWASWIGNLLGSGYLGVPFFLILSGFILTYNYLPATDGQPRRGLQRDEFWAARFARIYPTYLLALLLYAPIFFLGMKFVVRDTGGTVLFNASVIGSATLLLLQAFCPLETFQAWNEPGWTLSAEAFFYLLFPWSDRWIGRFGPQRAIVFLIGLAVAMMVIDTAIIPSLPTYGSVMGIHDRLFWSRSPLRLWPLFLAGSALCPLFRAMRGIPAIVNWMGAASVFLALLLIVLSALNVSAQLGRASDTFFSALLAMLLLTTAFDRGPLCRLLGLAPVLLLGESSYAIYILQQPVGAIITRIWARLHHQHHIAVDGTIQFIAIGILITVSVLVHLFFEAPMRRLVRSLLSR